MSTSTASGVAGAAPSGGGPRSDHRWWALTVLGLAQLMVVLDATIVNIALPSAQRTLMFSNADRQWVVTIYALTFGGLLLLGGRLADLFGRRRMFLTGLVGFAAASAMGGAAHSFGMLVLARGLQGVFGAVLVPAGLSLLTTTFTDGAERSKAFAIYGAIAGGGAGVGFLLGGLLTQYFNWRWCLFVNIGIAAVTIIGALLFLRDQQRAPGARLDLLGTVVAVGGLAGLVYGFSEASSKGWGNGETVTFLACSIVALAVFVVIEMVTPSPLLPMRVVVDRNRGGANLAILLAGVAMFGVFLFLTYYLQQTLGYSPVRTGLAFLPMIGGVLVSSTLVGVVLLPRMGARPIVVVGMLVVGAGMVLMSEISVTGGYVAHVMPALIVVGVGMGLMFSAAINAATALAEPRDAGVASAMPNVAQQIGGALGPALLNTIATSASRHFHPSVPMGRQLAEATASVHGYQAAFTVVYVILFASAAVSAFVLPGGRLPEAAGAAEAVPFG